MGCKICKKKTIVTLVTFQLYLTIKNNASFAGGLEKKQAKT